MLALIDGDVLLYRCGFAAEKSVYKVFLKGTEDEFGSIFIGSTMTQARQFIKDDPDCYIKKEVTPEPFENCLHSVKLQLSSILNDLDAKDFRIFLTGGNQFRQSIATIKPYKGNRDPDHKPYHYHNIKEYLIKQWKAEVIDYYEADDALAMSQWGEVVNKNGEVHNLPYDETIICTIDKDLDQIPGWHYNFLHKEKYWIDLEEADEWFYVQLIAGDITDNIQGIPGMGVVKATKILKTCKTNEERYQVAKGLYKKAYQEQGDAALLENAQLVYMTRVKGQPWTPPIT